MTPPIVDNPLFFLDYDGTLAPIVDEPLKAYPHPDVPRILEALSHDHPVFLVSGRYLADLGKLVTLPLLAIGLHGIQYGQLGGEFKDAITDDARAVIERMRNSVPKVEGIRIEDKGPMFAVHYRLAPDKETVRAALREWLSEVPDLVDPLWGKDVVELRPQGVSKGTAVLSVADEHPDKTSVYLGDDVTDEDAFRSLPANAVTVKVGDGDTAARYRLPDVDAVAKYLGSYLG